MNENRYFEKFQNKTDSDLEHILKYKEDYNDQAVSAAIQILKDRNGNLKELEVIENEIQVTKEKRIVAQKKVIKEEKKKSYITDDPNAPELHSKRVILIFSGLFSTIFGTVLLMYNMKHIDNPKGRIQVLVFGILYTISTLIIVNLLNVKGNITVIINIAGGWILTEYFWNKFIGKEFKHRKRSWIKPAILSIIITIPFVLAMIYG